MFQILKIFSQVYISGTLLRIMLIIPNVKFANATFTPQKGAIYRNQIVDFNFDQDIDAKSALTISFLSSMRAFLHDPITKDTFRLNPVDFTRNRCLNFPRTCISTLHEHASPPQTRLLHLFQDGAFGDNLKCPTASAFFQARAKVNPVFFKEWLHKAVDYYYANFSRANLVAKWKGKRLWAIDCSVITLPDNPETRETYTVQKNQVTDSKTVAGHASFAYDILNELPTNICFGRRQAEYNFLLGSHVKQMEKDIVAIYDRGYAGYPVIATHAMHSGDWVIRLPLSSTFKVVEDFVKGNEIDAIVDLQAPASCKVQVHRKIYPKSVRVRLVKIVLSTGETEVLMTSLLDQQAISIEDLTWLYAKRWGVETAFLRFKQQLKVEVFSSGKVLYIQQDVLAIAFLQTLEAILNKALDNSMRVESMKCGLKLEYHVNKSGAYTMLQDHLVGLFLLDEMAMNVHFIAFQEEVKLLKSPIRPDRHFPRNELTETQRLNFHLYRAKRG